MPSAHYEIVACTLLCFPRCAALNNVLLLYFHWSQKYNSLSTNITSENVELSSEILDQYQEKQETSCFCARKEMRVHTLP